MLLNEALFIQNPKLNSSMQHKESKVNEFSTCFVGLEKKLVEDIERPQFSIGKLFFLFRYCLQASRRVTMLSQMMHTEDRNLFGIAVVLARA